MMWLLITSCMIGVFAFPLDNIYGNEDREIVEEGQNDTRLYHFPPRVYFDHFFSLLFLMWKNLRGSI